MFCSLTSTCNLTSNKNLDHPFVLKPIASQLRCLGIKQSSLTIQSVVNFTNSQNQTNHCLGFLVPQTMTEKRGPHVLS